VQKFVVVVVADTPDTGSLADTVLLAVLVAAEETEAVVAD
jgi:hypothetical protein